jgi:uncharacterized protein (UPF0333 family)
MIAELLLLQGLLEKSNMVTPPESTSMATSTSTTRGKAEAAVKAYTEKARSYLDRFRYRR